MGLVHPIVVDADGVLIDGRNRFKACEMAGVEPTFARLNGEDAAAYILSANVERRSLTAGQKAIARDRQPGSDGQRGTSKKGGNR
jgi:ParB-like chromosome segregation protein Spo0J